VGPPPARPAAGLGAGAVGEGRGEWGGGGGGGGGEFFWVFWVERREQVEEGGRRKKKTKKEACARELSLNPIHLCGAISRCSAASFDQMIIFRAPP